MFCSHRAERAAGSGPRRPRAQLGRRNAKTSSCRASQTLDMALKAVACNRSWTSGLNHLTLGRARLYRAILAGRTSQATVEAQAQIEKAVAGLRACRTTLMSFLAVLVTRSWLRFVTGDGEGARADLDEAQEIAERVECGSTWPTSPFIEPASSATARRWRKHGGWWRNVATAAVCRRSRILRKGSPKLGKSLERQFRIPAAGAKRRRFRVALPRPLARDLGRPERPENRPFG